MAIDNKYGKVTLEKGTIGEDEPVVVFRAQDALLPQLLAEYYNLCDAAGSPAIHLDAIIEARAKVRKWQAANAVKIPRSDKH